MQIDKPTHQWQLPFEGSWPTSVVFLDDRRIAAGNRAGQIYLWELPDEIPEREEGKPAPLAPSLRFDGHQNSISRLLSVGDGRWLVSGGLDRTIRFWDTRAESQSSDEVVLDGKVREQRARRKSKEEKAAILDAPGVKVGVMADRLTLTSHTEWIKALAVNATGNRLISGDDSCLSVVWDLAPLVEADRPADVKAICQWRGYPRVWVSSAALSPDGATAFTAEFAGRRSSFDVPAAQARLWDSTNGEMKSDLLKVWTPKVKDEDRVDSYGYGREWGKYIKRGLIAAAFSPDGSTLALGQGGETDTAKVLLVDVKTGAISREVSGHKQGVCDVAFSADGKFVLSSGRDTVVRICQVSDGKQVAELGKGRGGQFKDWIHSLSVSPDQKRVAGADIAGMVHVWSL
ncbi:MAG: hypothetical protein QGG36_19935 [Pirellulaceae bacterium]|jgi:WD40 repeat protein|nr:hypothetical protein [Pirellulaceae bacterium]MDP7018085.1 hypothetical protein [Pirellulaceae bacterium]